MTTDEMVCQELVELVTAYLEGALAPADRARFEAHLAVCSKCRVYVEQMRDTIRALGRLGEDDLTPDARTALLRAFREWKRG